MVKELFAYIFGIYKKFGVNNPSILTPLDSVSVATNHRLSDYEQSVVILWVSWCKKKRASDKDLPVLLNLLFYKFIISGGHLGNILNKSRIQRLQNKSPDMIIESESTLETVSDLIKKLISKENDSEELLKDAYIPVELVVDDPRKFLELRVKITTPKSEK